MAKKQKHSSSSDAGNEKACAILSYILIGIIWYFVDEKMKKNEFVKYHVKQGLVLLIVAIIFSAIASIPFIGFAIGWILWLIEVVLMIIGMINAANNQEKELPVIGKFAEKFSF